ncbi:MAG TPA: cytochrome biogenesis protein, partial [Marinobacter hydrocarbonoclasticus]|nr:cytochrome biogenesis protein [Marinobacter nauticus]
MQPELYLSYPSAFLIGLLGSTHCLGMCGGIS